MKPLRGTAEAGGSVERAHRGLDDDDTLAVLGIGAGLLVVLLFFVTTAQHRVDRFMSFLNPMADPESSGYQAIKALMGFARGGFWGLGLGSSRQKWGALPEAHTDFILAVIGGQIGATVGRRLPPLALRAVIVVVGLVAVVSFVA